MCVYICVYICIYIYITEILRHSDKSSQVLQYIYIYIYVQNAQGDKNRGQPLTSF